MGDINRLIGNDGYVAIGELETALVGDATDDFDDLDGGGVGAGKGFYQVTAIAGTTPFFDWVGAKVGDYFWNDGTGVMAIGDTARALPKTALDSIKTFEIQLTKSKIDTTTLTDPLKTYRMGKSDAAGTMTGITTVNEEVISDRFLDRLNVDNVGAFTMTRRTKLPIYFVGYLQGEEISGEFLVAIVGKVDFEGFTYGAQDDAAQEYTTGFAPFAGDTLQKVVIEVA